MTTAVRRNMECLDETAFTLFLGNRAFGLRFDDEEVANALGHIVALTASVESIARLAWDNEERLDTDGIRHCTAAIELLSGLAHEIAKKCAKDSAKDGRS